MPEIVMPAGFGIIRYLHSFAGHSATVSIRHGFQLKTSDNTAAQVAVDAVTAITAPGSLWGTLSDWSSQTSFNGVDVYLQTAAGLTGAHGAAALSGTDSAPTEINATAPLIRVSTGLLGKQMRGRMYLPNGYISSGNVASNGLIEQSTWADRRNKILAWFAAIQLATSFDPYLLHSQPKAPKVLPNPTAITAFVLQTSVATQRRRMGG